MRNKIKHFLEKNTDIEFIGSIGFILYAIGNYKNILSLYYLAIVVFTFNLALVLYNIRNKNKTKIFKIWEFIFNLFFIIFLVFIMWNYN